jgi:hypothetical protein
MGPEVERGRENLLAGELVYSGMRTRYIYVGLPRAYSPDSGPFTSELSERAAMQPLTLVVAQEARDVRRYTTCFQSEFTKRVSRSAPRTE